MDKSQGNSTGASGPAAWLAPAVTGCAAGLLIYLTIGDRVIQTADEGIYLQGGLNVLRGALPFRDFFSVTGPGTFWLVAAMFRTFGIALQSARLLAALDIAAMAALVCWLVSRFATRAPAVGTSVLFVALCLSSPGNVVVNHRWDSSAFALAAIAAGLFAIQTARGPAAVLAGALAVLAAWITPSTALVAVVIGARLVFERRTPRLCLAYAAGATACGLVPAAILAGQHALIPMLQNLYWAGTHYSGVNRIAYGAVFGGAAALLGDAHGAQLAVRILFILPFLLPAWLPPLVALAWLPALRKPARPEVYLLLCGGALVASAYPRWDLLHLLYVSPVFLVLAALRMERERLRAARAAVFLLLTIPAAAMCSRSLISDGTELAMTTPVGRIRVSRSGAPAIQMCLTNVRPGDSLFVFPYEPFYYFLTGGRNPTRYLWLYPGMMDSADEREVLAQLRADPPEWILYRDVAPEMYLRIWPASDPARLRLNSIEDWIRANYQRQASAPSPDGTRELWKRRQAP